MEKITIEIAKQSLSKLPTLPLHMTGILQTINQDEVDIDELTQRISFEPTIVMRLLRVCNSPFYGIKGTVSSINRAVQILGLANVKQIVNALVLVSRLPLTKNALILENFWQHSISVAVLSDEIASHLGSKDKNQVFTAGLLHDFGQLLLATWYPDQYKLLLQETIKDGNDLFELEKQYFGLDHGEVGALLAEQWSFPSELCIALHYHHMPELNNSELAWILFVANIMHKMSSNAKTNPDENNSKLLEKACLHLSLPIANCTRIVKNGLSKAEAFASAL